MGNRVERVDRVEINEEDLNLNKQILEPIQLNNGKNCPVMGLGTALIKTEEDIDIIYQSIKDGVRLIDVQPDKEELVGKGIKKALNDKIVKRKELFIVAKLELIDKDNPEKALRETLKKLQLDYVDLYLDHWPPCRIHKEPKIKKLEKISVKDTWEKMEKLVDLELTDSIGVSNYNIASLLNIISICKIKPVVNEVEFHPYLYQKELKKFCDFENIKIFAYNPFVKGEYCKKIPSYEMMYDLFREGTITYLHRKENYKHLERGQIILNWYLSMGVIPIIGTSKKDRMKENLKARNFTMSKRNINLIGSMEDKQQRFNDGSEIFGIDIFA